jgi:hypothetical protein
MTLFRHKALPLAVPTTAAMPTSSPAKRRHRHAGLAPASTVPHFRTRRFAAR